MKKILLCLPALMTVCLSAQSAWISTNSPLVARYDDISFITKDTGWAAGTVNDGYINHTENGGASWNSQLFIPGGYMRSVEFATKMLGFAGGLEYSGHNVFFKTTDGGTTWTDISNVITGIHRGICGICCVSPNVTYAVGVWSSPSYVMKTTDGGTTWTQINMSAYARSLVDVQFTDASNGYVTGQSNINSEGAVILKTTDGGVTWSKVFTSNLPGEYVWKIQNLDGQNWFASIEAAVVAWNDSINNVFLKSTDGGNTWISKPVAYSNYFQGIGFINPLRGWIGHKDLYETNDGGNNWIRVFPPNMANGFDRFQKINDSTAYFSSGIVYKLGNTVTGMKEPVPEKSEKWMKVYPNPAKDEISCYLDLPKKTMFNLRVFNAQSELIWENLDQKEKGIYKFKVDKKLSPGIYFVYVMFNEGVECEKVIIE